MRVILIKNVSNLGKIGALVDVKDGYALNYLIPSGLAQDANPKNLSKIKSQQEQENRQKAKIQEQHTKLKKVIAGQTVILRARANDIGKLFAGVSTLDISMAIQTKFNLSVEPAFIKVPQPIKTLGQHEANLNLDGEVVKFWVVVEKI